MNPARRRHISDDGCVNVEQKRLSFDMGAYIDDLKKTTQYEEAHIWSKVIIKELETAKEHLGLFLRFVERYANSINDDVRPSSVDTCEKAYELWDKELRERG